MLHRAPPHDIVVMTGDLLDLAIATPQRRQIAWVTDWLNDFPRPISVCSGNHDLEWDSQAGRWTPAYWLRDLVNPRVWTDGQRVELNGLSFLNLGATTRPKGGEADVWVVHAAPSKTLVATRTSGAASMTCSKLSITSSISLPESTRTHGFSAPSTSMAQTSSSSRCWSSCRVPR
jgi:hypothetical protein